MNISVYLMKPVAWKNKLKKKFDKDNYSRKVFEVFWPVRGVTNKTETDCNFKMLTAQPTVTADTVHLHLPAGVAHPAQQGDRAIFAATELRKNNMHC